MKKIILALIVLGIKLLPAQVKWTNKNIFEQKNFVENKGQFDNEQIPNKETILFSAKIDNVQYYFTKSGYTIERLEKVEKTEEEMENDGNGAPSSNQENPEKENNYKFIKKFHELKFDGSNPSVNVVTKNQVSNFYSYSDLKSSNKLQTIIAKAYTKIIYKNLYFNTDVVFEFPKDSRGIEYSIILHPGADPSKIKLDFPNNNDFKIINNNIEIETSFGKIIHYQPHSFTADSRTFVKSKFVATGNNQIGFEIDKKEINKTIIINPWTITPNFGGRNSAYDVDYDNAGNVYAYGGTSTSFELVKLNPSGSLIWTYTPFIGSVTTFPLYGDFAVNRNTGSVYIIEGFNSNQGSNIVKLNSNGIQSAVFSGNLHFTEMWRIAFSRCTNQAVIAGGGITSPTNQTCFLDSSLTNLTPVQYVPTSNGYHDAGALALDNYGNCSQVTNKGFGDVVMENQLIKLPLPLLLPITYHVPTGYTLVEGFSNYFYDSTSYPVGYNGITTSGNFVYTYDSYVLKKWDGPTGNLLVYKRISYPAIDSSRVNWSGISADDCGNLFLADSNIVRQYDQNLNLINSYTMPGIITDINIANTGVLYVCGLGFVTTIAPANLINCQNGGLLSFTATIVNATCTATGSATATITGGNPPYNIVWNTNPPQYGLTITNVPAGTYVASVVDGGCLQTTFYDTVVISSINNLTATTSSTNVSCGNNDGTATCTPISGTSPYSYLWSNGQTTQTATGLGVGIDTCFITDSLGCSSSQTINVFSNNSITQSVTTTPAVCTSSSGTATITATGGTPPYTYLWSNGQTTQTATGLASGAFSCVVTDSIGCAQYQSVNIISTNPLVVTFSQLNNVCSSTPAFTLSGGNPPGGTYSGTGVTSNVFSPSIAGIGTFPITYMYADTNGCTNSAVSNIQVNTCIGINELLNQNYFTIYPNPFTSQTTITFSEEQKNTTIKITDVLGKLVYYTTVKDTKQITLTLNQEAGVYFVEVISDSRRQTVKLVKQ